MFECTDCLLKYSIVRAIFLSGSEAEPFNVPKQPWFPLIKNRSHKTQENHAQKFIYCHKNETQSVLRVADHIHKQLYTFFMNMLPLNLIV